MINSTKGKKIGIIVKTIIIIILPYYIGILVEKLLPLTNPQEGYYIAVYLLGCLGFCLLFFIAWITRAIFIWFYDDTGEKDPWQWGIFMNDDSY